MRFGIVSVGWNRPEVQKHSVVNLAQCRGAKHVDLYIVIDGGGMPRKYADRLAKRVRGQFGGGPYVVFRNNNWGLSRNILDAINGLYDAGYDTLCCMEDDVIPSRDFIELQYYCHEHFNLKKHKVFGVSGYTKRALACGTHDSMTSMRFQQWYTPDGISFTRANWKLVRERLERYYQNPRAAVEEMKSKIQQTDPGFANTQWAGGSYRHTKQAGFLQAIRAYHGMYTIVPCLSRCQDIGLYGYHQKQKSHKGERMSDREAWKKSMWYSHCWKEDHEWNELHLLKKVKARGNPKGILKVVGGGLPKNVAISEGGDPWVQTGQIGV